MSRWKIKSNTGCNHYSGEPCTRCWYVMDGAHGRIQGQQPQRTIKLPQFMPGFPEYTMFDNAFDPWDPGYPVSSREELRQMAEKQGVDSLYLKESMIWKSGPRRWV